MLQLLLIEGNSFSSRPATKNLASPTENVITKTDVGFVTRRLFAGRMHGPRKVAQTVFLPECRMVPGSSPEWGLCGGLCGGSQGPTRGIRNDECRSRCLDLTCKRYHIDSVGLVGHRHASLQHECYGIGLWSKVRCEAKSLASMRSQC